MRFSDAVKERYQRGLWTRYFFSTLNTYLAWPWTLLFVAVRMTPNQVSVLSLLVSLAGCALIVMAASTPIAWLGAGLLMLGIWWDHCDGQVARLSKNGTLGGGLLDTVFDRWVELGWVLALAVGLLVAPGAPVMQYPVWWLVAAVALAVHGNFYVRWANVQKDLYLLQKALRQAREDTPGTHRLEVDTMRSRPPQYNVKTFFIPFAFNRDVTFWMLAAITLSGFWFEGLVAFAIVHIARGLEMNWYTFQGLRGNDPDALARFLHPDYHK